MAVKKGLGKGLDALFFDNKAEISSAPTDKLKISEIEPNRNQPRKSFEEEPLSQLADSIREHGLIQPILVRPLENGSYQIVAGERRWRASRMAGLTEVPVIIKELDDAKAMELALIENLQRENLNPIEEALGYKELMDNFSMTQAEVSKSVGKSRSAVANTLRLLNLPEEVLGHVRSGELSSGHARAILAVAPSNMLDIARRAIKDSLNVRDIERLSKTMKSDEENNIDSMKTEISEARHRDSYFKEVEISLRDELNRKVRVTADKDGKGVLQLSFYNKEDLKWLMESLMK